MQIKFEIAYWKVGICFVLCSTFFNKAATSKRAAFLGSIRTSASIVTVVRRGLQIICSSFTDLATCVLERCLFRIQPCVSDRPEQFVGAFVFSSEIASVRGLILWTLGVRMRPYFELRNGRKVANEGSNFVF